MSIRSSHRNFSTGSILCLLSAFFPTPAAMAQAMRATLVSASTAGLPAGGSVSGPTRKVTADGRFVVFDSLSSNLVANDTNAAYDVFLRDTQTGTTTLLSVDSSGRQGNANSMGPTISADGRYVAFTSLASNLVSYDSNGVADVFVHDRSARVTWMVSATVRYNGAVAGDAASGGCAISADGTVVAFTSSATNFLDTDTNGVSDVYARALGALGPSRVSITSAGGEANNHTYVGSLSANGSLVACSSVATNLVPGDPVDSNADVYVFGRVARSVVKASRTASGVHGNYTSYTPCLSGDGSYVVFQSDATNLVANDTNQLTDIFRKDLVTGLIDLVSLGYRNDPANGASTLPATNHLGTIVAFISQASNLTEADGNGVRDVFVRNMRVPKTWRASVSMTGGDTNNTSYVCSMTEGGERLVYSSIASNLTPNDTNNATDVFVVDWAKKAEVRYYGTACPGSNSRPPLFTIGGGPILGSNMGCSISDVPPLTVVVLLMGSRPFDVDLAGSGAPGCRLLTSSEFVLPASASTSGWGNVYMRVSSNLGMLGVSVWAQMAALDPRANKMGFTLTRGAELVHGNL